MKMLFFQNLQQSWSNINSYEDPSAAVQFFNDTFLSLLDKHAPLKKKRVKKCQQPGWMNKEILNSIKTRDKFHNEKDMNNYNIWRNKVNSLIFKSKQEFFNDAINSYVKHPKNYGQVSMNLLVLNLTLPQTTFKTKMAT